MHPEHVAFAQGPAGQLQFTVDNLFLLLDGIDELDRDVAFEEIYLSYLADEDWGNDLPDAKAIAMRYSALRRRLTEALGGKRCESLGVYSFMACLLGHLAYAARPESVGSFLKNKMALISSTQVFENTSPVIVASNEQTRKIAQGSLENLIGELLTHAHLYNLFCTKVVRPLLELR